jgi:hypothetical protein
MLLTKRYITTSLCDVCVDWGESCLCTWEYSGVECSSSEPCELQVKRCKHEYYCMAILHQFNLFSETYHIHLVYM